MPRFHHVNLATPTNGLDDQSEFLIDVLGYRAAPIPVALQGRGLRWFDADDGSQIHLSEDPEHRPAARAHVAVYYGEQLPDVERRLETHGVSFRATESPEGLRIVLCQDPAGNRWELRGAATQATQATRAATALQQV